MAYYLSPVFQDAQLATSTGIPLVGGKLYTYLSNSTTPATVYQDDAGGSSHTNPIILNARGEPPAPIWINGGQAIKFALHDASDVPIRTIDDVTGVGDPTGITNTVSEWMTFSHAPTYSNATTFTVDGNHTADLNVGRRVKIPVSGNTSYGTITASSYGAPNTTVTINTTGSVGLDSSIDALSTFEIGLLSGSNQSVPYPLASFEYTTAGSSGAYTLSTICLGTLTTGERIRVKFHTAGPATGINTLTRDGLTTKALKRYDTTGAKIDANITADLLTDIEYDGTDYVVLTPLDLPHGKTRYTSNGTWTAPAGVTTIWLSGTGGGGGGGTPSTNGAGGGGGAECDVAVELTVVPGTAYAVTIGSGGAAANAGSATILGALRTLPGGAAGGAGGTGGAAGGAGGSAGGNGAGQSGVDNYRGGEGGGTIWGAGGHGGEYPTGTGTVGSGYGSGGGGGAGSSAGGAGRAGFLLIEW